MMKDTLTRQTAERLIEAATAAPSVHNSQPWRFVARSADRAIEIYADPARTLRRGDPRGRAVHIACGSALFNLRLAIAQAGHEPVARLLPSPRDPLLLATHHGVQAALLGPALEAPEAPAHGETVLAGEHPAVILQFGSGRQRPATARRPVAQVLRVPSPVAV
jgi:nitroreductase